MQITVKIKNVYGNDLVYPICEKSKIFALISGNKTLTDETIQLIKELGYGINVETKSL